MDQSNGEEDEVLFSLLLLSSPCVCEREREAMCAHVYVSLLCAATLFLLLLLWDVREEELGVWSYL
jgi:hypothetical protein